MLMARSRSLVAASMVALAAGVVSAQQVAEAVGDRVFQFHKDAAASAGALPSFALLRPLTAGGPVPTGVIVPTFSEQDGKQVVSIAIDVGTSLYGTGCATGPLLRNGRTITLWNTDAYGYADPAPSLYQSHPWVLAVRADGTAFGVMADTTWRTEIDLTSSIRFVAEGPAFPVVVIDRPTPMEVVQTLADLTGRIEMPPKWALGYHQCRYSYYPDSKVREIAKGFRDRKIPCDVIWMDIDYMRGFRCFTFDPQHFPDPKALNADLHGQGFHTVWMIDPGIKAETGYSVFDSGKVVDAWVKKPDGTTYNGEVWPGMCVFPDYTRQETRTWWAGLYKDFMATGIDGVWNDMNEPAVFNVKSKTMPEDNLHRADAALGGPGRHARFHNVYGMLMVKATRDGVMAANPDKRPFVLSRANYLGGQRYAAMWTGDNSADWEHLEASVPMSVNMGLSGQPFAGPDIGGFAGNGPTGQEGLLFGRWMGVGALLPFARGHTGKGNIDKEPWSFGEEVEKVCRQAIERRYQFMPYFYTLFHEAHAKGSPIVRPAFFADPRDPALRSEDDAFLLGGDVCVVPQMVPDRSRMPVRPVGWRGFKLEESSARELPELLIRPGAIVPVGPIMQYVDEKPLDPLTLLVNFDATGKASGRLYEDAGDGWGFRDGDFRLVRFDATLVNGKATVRVADVEGRRTIPDRKITVRFLQDGFETYAYGTQATGVETTLPVPRTRP
ncbi:MAG: TIM-barrel domain-containing protein [Phycisphaerales bacterium]